VSAFDDEFGLFGEEGGEAERTSTLGARKISSKNDAGSGVESENAPRRSGTGPRPPRPSGGGGRHNDRDRDRESHQPVDPVASAKRASDVLEFLAKKLVSKPDEVSVDLFADEDGRPVVELVVDPEDLGKVIGRSGRVAQALRTIVRATAEQRIAVDILDSEEAAETDDGEEPATDA
jgi:predicted RNA-binding protein YlqC (UPF0109 family)